MADIDDEIAELRKRLAQLEARRSEEKTDPTIDAAGPVAPAEQKKPNPAALVALAVIGVFALIMVARSCDPGPTTPAPSALATTAPVTPYTPPSPVTPATPPVPSYAWTYVDDVDPMSDRKTLLACVDSTDQVSLNPPYEPVTAKLCVRNSPKFGIDVYYALNGDGQILCDSYDGCSVKVRYGDAPAGRNGANSAADHSSNIVFLNGARAVAARLAKAKTTKIELTFYEAGVQSVTFPTEGLDLGKVGLSGKAKARP
ncbi:hypothetical protein ACN2C6_19215 (plasmid) [Caulobacter sp. ErkDOM-YI]|uniref:hypothetical protein n=1 Tax=unclassified Caulobacter TaxID=2648921 RepID=UPI003AF5A9B8